MHESPDGNVSDILSYHLYSIDRDEQLKDAIALASWDFLKGAAYISVYAMGWVDVMVVKRY